MSPVPLTMLCCSPPLIRAVQSRYLNYDTFYPRSSTPITCLRKVFRCHEPVDGFTQNFAVNVDKDGSTSRTPSPKLSVRTSPRSSPKRSLKSLSVNEDQLPPVEKLNLQDEAGKMAMPSESLIRLPFQDTLPDKEYIIFDLPETPSSTINDLGNCKKSVEPSPSEPFVPRFVSKASLDNFTEYRSVGGARHQSSGPPPFFRSLLNPYSDTSSTFGLYPTRLPNTTLVTDDHEIAEQNELEPNIDQAEDVHPSADTSPTHDDLPPPAGIAKPHTLRDISTILQVAGRVYKDDQELSKDSILQLGVLYKEADEVLRSTVVDDASALLHDAEEQHRLNQQLIKDFEEEMAVHANIGGIASSSRQDRPVEDPNATKTSTELAASQIEAAHISEAEDIVEVTERPKIPIDVSAILHAADAIGDLCSSDIVDLREMTLNGKSVDKDPDLIGDSSDVKDAFARSSKKPTASGEARSQDTTDEFPCGGHWVGNRQRRMKCKHKGDSSSSLRDSLPEAQSVSIGPSAPLGVLERLRRRVLKSSPTERNKTTNRSEGLTTDASVEILSFPSQPSVGQYHSPRQESSVVLVDFVSPFSQRVPHPIPLNKPRCSAIRASASSPGESSTSSTSLSDEAAPLLKADESRDMVAAIEAEMNHDTELAKVV